MILTRAPRNFARCFLLAVVLLVWQGAAFAIDRLPDRRSTKTSPSKSATSNQLSASSESLIELLGQVDSLQGEIQELRNQSEVQAHEIERLKAQQKDVLRDLDQRLGRLERGEKRDTTSRVGQPVITGQPPAKASPSSKQSVTKQASPKNKPGSQAKREYDAAFALLKQGAYEKATKSFRSFVKRNPKHNLTGNAQYWIGEANYVMRNFKVALKEFKKVPANYPRSNKVADAQLKIGYVYFELEDWSKARKTLNDVIKRYPNTRVAKYAQNRLARIKKGKKKAK